MQTIHFTLQDLASPLAARSGRIEIERGEVAILLDGHRAAGGAQLPVIVIELWNGCANALVWPDDREDPETTCLEPDDAPEPRAGERFTVTVWHGEWGSCWYVVDTADTNGDGVRGSFCSPRDRYARQRAYCLARCLNAQVANEG